MDWWIKRAGVLRLHFQNPYVTIIRVYESIKHAMMEEKLYCGATERAAIAESNLVFANGMGSLRSSTGEAHGTMRG